MCFRLYKKSLTATDFIEFENENKYQLWSQIKITFMLAKMSAVFKGKKPGNIEVARCMDCIMTKADITRFGEIVESTNNEIKNHIDGRKLENSIVISRWR